MCCKDADLHIGADAGLEVPVVAHDAVEATDAEPKLVIARDVAVAVIADAEPAYAAVARDADVAADDDEEAVDVVTEDVVNDEVETEMI